jgi:hypothetical protein
MLGMNTGSQITRNLLRERECVLNLPPADLAAARPSSSRSLRRTASETLLTALKAMENCHNGTACWAAAHLSG